MQYNRKWHEKAGDTGRQGFAQQPQLRRACTETERELIGSSQTCMHVQMLLARTARGGREKGVHGERRGGEGDQWPLASHWRSTGRDRSSPLRVLFCRGHMQLDRGEIIEQSCPLHVTVRPAGGRGRERGRRGEERGRRGSKKQKGRKLEREAFLAPCMDFELAACMFSPIPWPGPPKRCGFAADPGQMGYLPENLLRPVSPFLISHAWPRKRMRVSALRL